MSSNINAITAQFTPISLADLNAQAALQTRADNKYIVSAEIFASFAEVLSKTHRVLEIKGVRAFAYDTLYFDTPDMISYWNQIQGRRRRFKARSRHYLDSNLCVFELKLKGGRGETIKHKINYTQDELATITPAAKEFLRKRLHEDYGFALSQPLVPTVLTHYRRVTITSMTSVERITCDFDLAFATEGEWKGKIRPGHVLIETKSERGRSDTDHLLWRLGARPTSGSKYCLGLSLARPELRNNPFRHTRNAFFVSEVDARRVVRPTAAPVTSAQPVIRPATAPAVAAVSRPTVQLKLPAAAPITMQLPSPTVQLDLPATAAAPTSRPTVQLPAVASGAAPTSRPTVQLPAVAPITTPLSSPTAHFTD
jgi:hypothetical protein